MKISVIIPMYNAEKTIIRCLESITETQHEDYEIIVVDDGSTDDSVRVINDYMTSNIRIRLLSQPNSGPSAARNRGVEAAQGDIVVFVDCDDYVSRGYLEELADAFTDSCADVVFFEFVRVTPDGEKISAHVLPQMQGDYYRDLIALSENDIFGYTWVKAFRRCVIGKVRFDEQLNLLEDEVFTCQVLREPVSIFFLRKPLYYYVRQPGTLANRTHQDYCAICDRVWNEWRILLNNDQVGQTFLQCKAEKMAQVCKWYVLERHVNSFAFYRQMMNSHFLQSASKPDVLLDALKKKNWCRVVSVHLVYKAKTAMSKWLKRRA